MNRKDKSLKHFLWMKMTEGKLDEAEDLLVKCGFKLQSDEQRKKITNTNRHFRGIILLETLSQKFEKLKEVVSSSYDEQDAFINNLVVAVSLLLFCL